MYWFKAFETINTDRFYNLLHPHKRKTDNVRKTELKKMTQFSLFVALNKTSIIINTKMRASMHIDR